MARKLIRLDRIKKNEDFASILKKGIKVGRKNFNLFYSSISHVVPITLLNQEGGGLNIENGKSSSSSLRAVGEACSMLSFGYIASKKLGKANLRNRARRLLKASVNYVVHEMIKESYIESLFQEAKLKGGLFDPKCYKILLVAKNTMFNEEFYKINRDLGFILRKLLVNPSFFR